MNKIDQVLAKYGLSDKEVRVYTALLELGPAPVRKIAGKAGVNRGTTYDILKSLKEQGLASYYHKDKHQYFVAEDPKKLFDAWQTKMDNFATLKNELKELVPQLRFLAKAIQERPVVTYYDGLSGIRIILQDVLDQVGMQPVKEYYVYSSASVRKHLYAAYPDFTEQRIAQKIKVKVVAVGAGGEIVELAERKWLTKNESAPTYTLIYSGRLAMISTSDEGLPVGLIIQNQGIYKTQKLLFESLWARI
ncbi:MAG: helix-turn-helix domain-containing protein [Patescibacteria group bacterium]